MTELIKHPETSHRKSDSGCDVGNTSLIGVTEGLPVNRS